VTTNNPDPGELIAEAKTHADWLSDGKRDPSTARILYDLVSALEQQAAMCKRLAETLTPFVLANEFYGAEWQDSDDIARGRISPLSVGDLRKALAALKKL